ncbi:RNA-dependent RNA polymerase [Beihai weivirus-like virus 13]|uniref:RNA-dependent RNA polymerase n=1 Tax=Beihai weivirus-like virus 13 TaxID=1922742 RepID=UPI00090B7F40|nr:RNA-dependent RNA polymerase [Beihai weivirus-like virus 13]APG78110.1 RNA-dependent RNA polymerase [Beihai weivirus-like virus 13]
MAVVSFRPPSRRNDLCYECHSWMLQHLTYEHASGRADVSDTFLYELELQVARCGRHVETCAQRIRDRLGRIKHALCGQFHGVGVHHVYLTRGEVDIMRRSGGAALYSGAPTTTADSNLHFATYRLDKKERRGDPISCATIDQLFGYLAATIQQGRVANRHCCCLHTAGLGLRNLRPVKRMPEDEPEPPKSDDGKDGKVEGPPEDDPPQVDCHTCHSGLAGIQLIHDVNEGPETIPLAVRYLPQIEERLFWLNSQKNVERAIKERIEEPHVPVTLSQEEKDDLRAVTQVMIDQLKADKGLIDKIIQDKLGIYGWKSKKWAPARAEKALSELRATFAPKFRFDAGIKLEPSKRGKAPRLLIADGDRGQVMSWVLIGTLEAWLFKRWRHRSIKGLPKTEAMQRVCQSLRQKDPRAGPDTPDIPVSIVENDGSAWDACMSETLRSLTENPVMEAVAEMVEQYFLVEGPPEFIDARVASNRLTKLQLGFRKGKGGDDYVGKCDLPKGKAWQTIISAIRRSGCRGTSCLNFLANMICWAWVIGGRDACKLVRPQGARVTCVDGVVRFVKMVFEGDDSILSFVGLNTAGQAADQQLSREYIHTCTQRWTKLGHRPKLYWRAIGAVAEFTGWHFSVSDVGIGSDCAAPDLIRNLTNMAYSINAAAINATAAGDRKALMSAVAPGVIARLYPMAEKFPMLCKLLYGQFAHHLRDTTTTDLTRDEIYALELEPEDFGFKESDYNTDMDLNIERATQRFQPILERFEMAIGRGNEQEEADLAVRLGLVPDNDKYYDLLDAIEGGYRVGADSAAFARSVEAIREG